MTVTELTNLLLVLGFIAVCVTATVEMFSKLEEARRAHPKPPWGVLGAWLKFSSWFGQDVKALFWSVIASETLLWAGWLEIRGEGAGRYVVTAFFALAAYAVASKIGYDLFWKTIRSKFEEGVK